MSGRLSGISRITQACVLPVLEFVRLHAFRENTQGRNYEILVYSLRLRSHGTGRILNRTLVYTISICLKPDEFKVLKHSQRYRFPCRCVPLCTVGIERTNFRTIPKFSRLAH